jgi:hypothetical protein
MQPIAQSNDLQSTPGTLGNADERLQADTTIIHSAGRHGAVPAQEKLLLTIVLLVAAGWIIARLLLTLLSVR